MQRTARLDYLWIATAVLVTVTVHSVAFTPSETGLHCFCTGIVIDEEGSPVYVSGAGRCTVYAGFNASQLPGACDCFGTNMTCATGVSGVDRTNETLFSPTLEEVLGNLPAPFGFNESEPCVEPVPSGSCGNASGLASYAELNITSTLTTRNGVDKNTTVVEYNSATTLCLTPDECNLDCVVEVGPYGPCSRTCDGGVKVANLTVIQSPTGNGDLCPDPLTRQVACNNGPCPVDCEVSDFGPFGTCNATCVGQPGFVNRTRTVDTPASYGGQACPPLVEFNNCTSNATCPAVDCTYTAFGAWSNCSVDCRNGTRSRTRAIATQASGNGTACNTSSLVDTQTCTAGVCSCTYTAYGSFSPCSAACGNGTRTRSRRITWRPNDAGFECDAITETVACAGTGCSASDSGLSLASIIAIAAGTTLVVIVGFLVFGKNFTVARFLTRGMPNDEGEEAIGLTSTTDG